MRRYRNGKIIATIGPASNTFEKLENLFLTGVDIFRLNFSHGSHETHQNTYNSIRAVGKKYKAHITILADLQGPKLRIGTFENDKIILEKGDIFRFDLDHTPGNTRRVNLPHPEILEALKVDSILLLDDGKIKCEVTNRSSTFAEVEVLAGGVLSNRKGVNVPDVMLNIPALTEKDLNDLNFSMDLGVDWVALSFVQSREDVEQVKQIVNGKVNIVSKLEKPMAIKSLEPIIDISDGIMIARGDLGVEMNPEELPSIQRRIINTCHRMGKPVIVATHMLESMIASPSPTRAEISDVATAVYSGADATMLSAETASGQYPFDAVQIMNKTIIRTEADPYCIRRLEDNTQLPHKTVNDAICCAAKNAAEYADANAIMLFTDSFDMVVRCSRLRPKAPIILVTDSQKLANKVGLCYGVYAIVAKKEFSIEAIAKSAKSISKEYQFAETGDTIVVLNDITGTTIEICNLN